MVPRDVHARQKGFNPPVTPFYSSIAQRCETTSHSIHPADELVNLFLAVARVTALDEVDELSRVEPAVRVGKLEGPKLHIGGRQPQNCQQTGMSTNHKKLDASLK
jgi:hypothetical protein